MSESAGVPPTPSWYGHGTAGLDISTAAATSPALDFDSEGRLVQTCWQRNPLPWPAGYEQLHAAATRERDRHYRPRRIGGLCWAVRHQLVRLVAAGALDRLRHSRSARTSRRFTTGRHARRSTGSDGGDGPPPGPGGADPASGGER
jgi:hypothetical protein